MSTQQHIDYQSLSLEELAAYTQQGHQDAFRHIVQQCNQRLFRTAIAAMLAGMLELARIPEGPALKDTQIHMAAMLTAFCFFLASLILRLEELQPQAPNMVVLITDAIGFIALAFGGYMGGRLVYGHGLGR